MGGRRVISILTNTFGRVLYIVEFQKRGLPHAHILLILENSHKPHTPEHVETIISTEIPDQAQYPELYETVVNCMLHGSLWTVSNGCIMHEKWKIFKGIFKGIL